MDEEKINKFAASVVRFINTKTNEYKLVPFDWRIELSNLYKMPSWESNERKCFPTLCFIQRISNDDEVNREVVKRILFAFLNQKYLRIESIPDEGERNKIMAEKAQKSKQIEDSVKEMTGQFIICYYYHGNFMDGEMNSYDYLPF